MFCDVAGEEREGGRVGRWNKAGGKWPSGSVCSAWSLISHWAVGPRLKLGGRVCAPNGHGEVYLVLVCIR